MAASAPDVVDQGLDFVGRPLVAKEAQDDADGFFRDSILYSGFRSQSSYQFIHMPRPNRLLAGASFVFYLDLLHRELQAIPACGNAIQLRSRHECCRDARADTTVTTLCHGASPLE